MSYNYMAITFMKQCIIHSELQWYVNIWTQDQI